jgi:hypothetical protein
MNERRLIIALIKCRIIFKRKKPVVMYIDVPDEKILNDDELLIKHIKEITNQLRPSDVEVFADQHL